MQPLILTARMDADAQLYFDRLREEHFPAERNFLSAHITLFHALPGEQRAAIADDLTALTSRYSTIWGSAASLRFLGRGVAFTIRSEPLLQLRAALAALWAPSLTPQDAQVWRPHITVQNKVEPRVARALFQELSAGFRPTSLRFEGLNLWRYQGGPWQLAGSYSFGPPI